MGLFIESTPDSAAFTVDRKGRVADWNIGGKRLFGYASGEIVGRSIAKLFPRSPAGNADTLRRGLNMKIRIDGGDGWWLRKNNSRFWGHLLCTPLRDARGSLCGMAVVIRDLTKRRLLERQIIESAANEQRRISHDLHDGLCQDLLGIAFGIDDVVRHLSSDSNAAPIVKLAVAVREAAGQARQLAHGLNPVDLKAGGLPVALEHLAAKVATSFGVHCSFQWDGIAHVRNDVTATHLHRIAQEAASNAIHHGKANVVRIRLFENREAVVLSIADNGMGIPKAARIMKRGAARDIADHAPPPGIGLQIMYYRAQVIGGTFAVTPRKGGGTKVTCTVNREELRKNSQRP